MTIRIEVASDWLNESLNALFGSEDFGVGVDHNAKVQRKLQSEFRKQVQFEIGTELYYDAKKLQDSQANRKPLNMNYAVENCPDQPKIFAQFSRWHGSQYSNVLDHNGKVTISYLPI